jgi:hypothetical protein
MIRHKSIRIVLFGILIWLVPFITGFIFYDRSGKLNVSEDFFKSAMILISSLTGMYALQRYFRLVEKSYFQGRHCLWNYLAGHQSAAGYDHPGTDC